MEEQKPFWKKPIFIIGTGLIFFVLLILIVVLAVISTDPLREYETRFQQYSQDCDVTSEERAALDMFVQNKKIQTIKAKEIETRILAEKCARKSPQQTTELAHKDKTTEATQQGLSGQETSLVNAKINLQQGMNYMRAKDWDNAINEFTLAIQKYPQYDTAYSNRAVAYMQQKKFNKAMDDLKEAEKINPKNPNVHYNFTCWYSLQNQLDRALDSLDKALQYGFTEYDALRNDPDLNNLRKHPEFRKILEKHKVFIK